MIIKIHKSGRSFKGVCTYLTHDPEAQTSERVAWTHTLNLAHDDLPLAVDEMLWTFRSADLLKREAGLATGGAKLEKPVKHFSLSWPHGETPTREHMVETVQAYMKHMGWSEHQAIIVAHSDTRHPHVHVVLNSVSPMDGRAARSSHDWRRSENFALQYEREHGQIHCEQRLKPSDERDATPTRENWQRFKKSEAAFERAEIDRITKTPGYFERHDTRTMNGREWDALKAFQQQQREAFFMDGKEAFRAVRKDAFREVREEFRGQWSAYYTARRHGDDPAALAATKAALLDAQRKALDERRAKACDELREQRDKSYEKVLEQQRFDRAELGRRQQQGLRTYQLFDVVYPVTGSEPTVGDGKAWHTQRAGVRTVRGSEFRREANAIADPIHHAGSPSTAPGVKRREPSVKENGLPGGRTLRAQELKSAWTGREPAREPPAPTSRNSEVNEASAEKLRVQRSQEMTDQKRGKDQNEAAARMRASWNRTRGRGGRD